MPFRYKAKIRLYGQGFRHRHAHGLTRAQHRQCPKHSRSRLLIITPSQLYRVQVALRAVVQVNGVSHPPCLHLWSLAR